MSSDSVVLYWALFNIFAPNRSRCSPDKQFEKEPGYEQYCGVQVQAHVQVKVWAYVDVLDDGDLHSHWMKLEWGLK